MKALSIKQPWASLIASGAKDIENRDWSTGYRGLVAIHASAKLDKNEMESACALMQGFVPKFSAQRFRADTFPGGAILGVVEIVGCVKNSESPWFAGKYGFVLRNAVRFADPIPCKGTLLFWAIPEDVLAQMREQWRATKVNGG